MSGPGAFETAYTTGTNLGGAFKEARDENTIESIISESLNSGDPKVLQNNIGRILSQVSPERQGTAIQFLQNTYNNVLQKQELERKRQAEQQAGVTPGLAPTLQAQQMKDRAKSERLSQFYGGGIQSPQKDADDFQDQNTSIDQIQDSDPEEQITDVSISKQDYLPKVRDTSPFRKMSEDQLIQATGSEDKEVSRSSEFELKRRSKLDEIKNTQKLASRKEQVGFHNESEKFDSDLRAKSRIAKNQKDSVKNIFNALASGKINPSSYANVFKVFGKVGQRISDALLSKDEATLLAEIPNLLHGWKEVFGVRLTDADLSLLESKLPSIGKSPEANMAVLKILSKYADMTLLRDQIGKNIKKQNDGLRPLGYEDLIEDQFDKLTEPVKIINPNTKKVIEIPAYMLSDALASGGTLVNDNI